ncbi:MAG: nucleotidyltransferase domain-containing protein [Bacteroidota bacterium]
MNSKTFGEFIREHRIKKEWSLRQLAHAIDIDQSSLSKIERNQMISPEKFISPLSKQLSIDFKILQIQYLSDRLFKELSNTDFALEAITIVKKRLEKQQRATSFELQRATLVENIKKYIRQYPIEKAWLFGSFAREEESHDSDIDLMVRFIQPHDIDLFKYIGIKQDLEEITGRQVDIVEEGQELEDYSEFIKADRQLIYERKTN